MTRAAPAPALLLPGVLAGLILASCGPKEAPVAAASATTATPGEIPADARSFTVLHMNDTYRIEGTQLADSGGLAKVRTLRAQLEAEGPVLVTHGGDLLAPSLLSRTYDGEQMVDVLNHLDGDPEAFDEHLFVVFGNHEFDADDMEDLALLQDRIDESDFTWLDNGIRWVQNDVGEPQIFGQNLLHTDLVELGGVKVGLYSLTIDKTQPAYVTGFDDDVEAARRAVTGLREAGAEVIIGLTHLTMEQDVAVVEALGKEAPHLVMGGHEHNAQAALTKNGVWVAKGDADALSVRIAEVSAWEGGVHVALEPEPRPLDPTVPSDPAVQEVVDGWLADHEVAYCDRYFGGEAGCLSKVLTKTNTLLEAEELAIRRFETGFGSWAADLALAQYADEGAQVAFMNSGSLRLNQNLPGGTPVTQQVLEELLPYPSGLVLLELDGETLQEVVDHAVEDWTGSGHWLQLSGFAFRHDWQKGKATDLHLLTAEGPVKVTPGMEIKAVVMEYLVNPRYDQDGYLMLSEEMVISDKDVDLKDVLAAAFAAAGEAGISPELQGRVCTDHPDRPPVCALDGE